jgi:S1-C subfamily serine protease
MRNFFIMLMLFMDGHVEREPSPYSAVNFDASWGLKLAYTSSVIVQGFNEQGPSMGSGNAIRIFGQDYIITAAHVVKDSVITTIIEKNSNEIGVDIISIDTEKDIAILKPLNRFRATNAAQVKVRTDNTIGKEVFHCGHPSITYFNASEGIITGHADGHYITNAFSLPGSSGSLVFGKRGDIIGVVVSVGVFQNLGSYSMSEELVRVVPLDYLYLTSILRGQEGAE